MPQVNSNDKTTLGIVAVACGVVGFSFAYFMPGIAIPVGDQEYLSLAALAGLDSLVGGIRASTEGKFQSKVFISGFVMNTLLAVFLAYLGERLGQDIGLAALVLLGGRTFVNLSIIRRHWLDSKLVGPTPSQSAPRRSGKRRLNSKLVGPSSAPAATE